MKIDVDKITALPDVDASAVIQRFTRDREPQCYAIVMNALSKHGDLLSGIKSCRL